jgi:murein DD-endopeptidase MepM/ murein hydrolase activator NlpD
MPACTGINIERFFPLKMVMMQRRLLALVTFFFIGATGDAQNYPQNYFRNPLNIPMELVANFGELRANHWHMGLDIRTQQKQNLRVHAAAEGYIARVKIEPGGFGLAIYINHPNGYTTLYAHLNNFFPALEQYVKAEQYKRESWQVELEIPAKLFPVNKGSFIAFSGNTGGSQGPHVHFEIRDTKTEECLNPLLFGMPITDNVPPIVSRLAMYDRTKSVYQQSPKYLALKKAGGIYSTGLVKVASNKISFAIGAIDRFTNSGNNNGIYSARLLLDGVPQSEFVLDKIDYLETRYLNAHIDYRLKFNGGPYLQHLSCLPGDRSDVYTLTSDGVLRFDDDQTHQVRIEVRDAKKNLSVIEFSVRYEPSAQTAAFSEIPNRLTPEHVNVFESEDFEVFTSEFSVYDTVNITHTTNNAAVAKAISPLNIFCSAAIPTHDSILVRIRPSIPISEENRNRVIIKSVAGTRTVVEKAEWQQDWLAAKFRQFGSFQAFIDDEPPTVNNPPTDLTKATRLVFNAKDNFKSIKRFRVEIDGQWLRFTNDKWLAHIYVFDEKFPRGQHALKVTVEDEAGNITEKIWNVRR